MIYVSETLVFIFSKTQRIKRKLKLIKLKNASLLAGPL